MRNLALIFTCAWLLQAGCDNSKQAQQVQTQTETVADPAPAEPAVADSEVAAVNADVADSNEEHTKKKNWISLFDKKSLNGWEAIEFGGEGEVEIVEGTIRMLAGDPLTGIRVTEDVKLPKANYEISFDAMKEDGVDFFAAITFPVNDTFCTFVIGGWGGTLVGLSNLDGQDASENDTKLRKKFEPSQWYSIRIQVLPDRITAWIDDEKLVDQSIEGVEVSIRNDVISTTPLGITNFITSSRLREIKIRDLE